MPSSRSAASFSLDASEAMASGDELDFLWSGVEVSASVSEANEGSDGSGTVGEEPECEDEELLESSFDFEGSLEIAVGIVEDEGNGVDRAAEGGSSDLNLDSAEEFVQGRVGEEADWVDERVLAVSLGNFVEEPCGMEENTELAQESGGSGRSEQDHATEVVDFEETLGVDGSSVAHSSDVVDNSNMDGDLDLADTSGISSDGREEGHTSEESSDFDDDSLSEGDINLGHNNPGSEGVNWGFVNSLRGGSRDNVIQGDNVVLGDLDNEGLVEQIFDQILRSDVERLRRAASSAAAKDVVERLPVMEVKEGMFKGSDSDGACAVCKNNVQVDERVRRLPCLHYFHEECIMPWLEIRNTCPLCRHELPIDDIGSEGIGRRRVDSGSREGG